MKAGRFWITSVRFASTQRKNFYEILGVSHDANNAEIKRAYISRCKHLHPDVTKQKDEQFLELKEAYDTLRDDDRRSLYDRTGRSSFSSPQSRQTSRFDSGDNGGMFVNDPAARHGHFFDPRAVQEQERTNRRFTIAFTLFLCALIVANILYVHRLKERQAKRKQAAVAIN
ncbi:J domain-containing protein [Aphelenchoides fujianensis]|nr:J domain-containing protein [Aphelenchoides fujianensis]